MGAVPARGSGTKTKGLPLTFRLKKKSRKEVPMPYDTSQALSCLTSVFLNVLEAEFPNLSDYEDRIIDIGHGVMVHAMGAALELFDKKLHEGYAPGITVHELKSRTLATRIGDLRFSRRVCRDEYGNSLVPLDEVLDLPYEARISPGAGVFLVDAGIEVSYAKAARLLERSGGSHVSARSVMGLLDKCGRKCEQDDIAAAHELYVNGVLPEASSSAAESVTKGRSFCHITAEVSHAR